MRRTLIEHVSIDSHTRGFATTITTEEPAVLWWKWYQTIGEAFKEAEELGYASKQQQMDPDVRHRSFVAGVVTLKIGRLIDLDVLAERGFEERNA